MLSNITIHDLAIIDEISVDFQPGFNVLSGETGAGKSIIINALALVLGDRASAELVRSGAEEARVEVLFVTPPDSEVHQVLERLGLPSETELLLSRQVHVSGRSQCRLNGSPLTLSMLREVGAALVDLHGQHEHQSLLRTETHLLHLDAAGGEGHLNEVERFAEVYEALREVRDQRRALQQDDRARAQRVDLLEFQVREIESANLRPGEEQSLLDERRRLGGIEKLGEAAALALSCLTAGDDGSGAVEALARAWKALASVGSVDSALEPLVADLEACSVQAQECLATLRGYVDGLEADPARLDVVEARLHQLSQLKRKYGETVETVIAHGAQAQQELEALTNSEARLQELEQELHKAEARVAEAGLALSRKRHKLARSFEEAVMAQFRELAMERARFLVDLRREPDDEGVPVEGKRLACSRSGFDRVQFLLAPNPGEPPKPLAKIVSGGEMSRVMLAIKSASAQTGNISTWVFDEVDAGIGGATAEVVGRKLTALSKRCQSLCVTHLAQIASQAAHHQVVHKSAGKKSTKVEVVPLTAEARVEEIARMLSGELTETSRRHAAEMLARRGGRA
jgi:DNA repair protein RecN (Recombination protein N)